jgi:hypothetical protein
MGKYVWSQSLEGGILLLYGTTDPNEPGPPLADASRSHSLRHSTFDRTPLDELSARRRGLYLKTHNTHERQTSTLTGGI